MKKFNLIILIFITTFIVSCNNTTQKEEDINAADAIDSSNTQITKMTDKEIGDMISIIPNPVEMSALLQKSGVIYSQELLNPSRNISKYNVKFKKALNLGVYGTDLVYMNIYDRTVSTLTYLSNVKDLANDLKIGQFFDYKTLNRLSENNKNVDSVLFITSSGFDKMNRFLMNENRASVSALIAYGTWVESLYLATNIQKVTNKQAVYTRIGEQQVVLDNILLLLAAYKSQEEFKELYEDAKLLKKEFDKVTIKHEYKAPEKKIINGMMVIIDNSSSTVQIDDKLVGEISKVVKLIRNKIIS